MAPKYGAELRAAHQEHLAAGVYPLQWSDIIITLCIDCDGTYQCSLMHSDCGKIFAKKYCEKQ